MAGGGQATTHRRLSFGDAVYSRGEQYGRCSPKDSCIEDNREAASLIAEELVDRGFDVGIAHGGQEGLMAVMTATPDLILCDVSMPGMTGFEVLERLNEIAPESGPDTVGISDGTV
jgi:PleD family two-component response regulator